MMIWVQIELKNIKLDVKSRYKTILQRMSDRSI